LNIDLNLIGTKKHVFFFFSCCWLLMKADFNSNASQLGELGQYLVSCVNNQIHFKLKHCSGLGSGSASSGDIIRHQELERGVCGNSAESF
jgi:hypothetical protein